MAPATVAPRRRVRKRKRRAVSSSSSSSSSPSSSDSETSSPPMKAVAPLQAQESSESSSSSSESDSDSEPEPLVTKRSHAPQAQRGRSPSPPSAEIPSFIPADKEKEKVEELMKERFRKFYLSSLADEFKGDLEEIRKEPNLTTSKLGLLIDSLASGAEVFSHGNEMEVVVGDQ